RRGSGVEQERPAVFEPFSGTNGSDAEEPAGKTLWLSASLTQGAGGFGGGFLHPILGGIAVGNAPEQESNHRAVVALRQSLEGVGIAFQATLDQSFLECLIHRGPPGDR